jgi:hypothetical protein
MSWLSYLFDKTLHNSPTFYTRLVYCLRLCGDNRHHSTFVQIYFEHLLGNLQCMQCSGSVIQGQLQEWTEHSTLNFENLKSVEISKNIFNIT